MLGFCHSFTREGRDDPHQFSFQASIRSGKHIGGPSAIPLETRSETKFLILLFGTKESKSSQSRGAGFRSAYLPILEFVVTSEP